MSGSVIARLDHALPSVQAAPPLAKLAANVPGDVQPALAMVQLTALPRHATGVVAGVRVTPPGSSTSADPAIERIALRLMEIGFVEGERLCVVAFGQPGDDPIGVRIGGRGGASTFALRRQEAACVWVWPDPA